MDPGSAGGMTNSRIRGQEQGSDKRKCLTVLARMHTYMYNWKMRVEWDRAKARANLEKHGVAFSEAVTALADDFALTREDPDCFDEQRFITLGLSATGLLLVVVYTHREPDILRIISAWRANKPQRTCYEKNRS